MPNGPRWSAWPPRWRRPRCSRSSPAKPASVAWPSGSPSGRRSTRSSCRSWARWPISARWPSTGPVDADDPSAHAFTTGEVQIVPEVPADALDKAFGDPLLAGALAAVPIGSGVIVPIVARGQPIGTLALLFSEPGRSYDSQLRFAAEG